MILSVKRTGMRGERKSMLRRNRYNDIGFIWDMKDHALVPSIGMHCDSKQADRVKIGSAFKNYKMLREVIAMILKRDSYTKGTTNWSVWLYLKLSVADIAFIGLSCYLHRLHFIRCILVKRCPHFASSGFLNGIFKSTACE